MIILTGYFYGNASDWSKSYGFYGLIIMPMLCLIGYFVGEKFANLDQKLMIKFLSGIQVFGLSIVALYMFNFIDASRYQHVGNAAALSVLISFYKNDLKKSKLTKFMILLFILSVLMIGSRQALLGLIIAISAIKWRTFNIYGKVISLFSVFIAYKNIDDLINLIFNFGNNYSLYSVTRFAYNYMSGEESRWIIYQNYIEMINWEPHFITYKIKSIELPHNFYLETSYVSGLFFGILFAILTVYILIRTFKENLYLGSILILYFIPFNVSSGWTASKYFLFFSFFSLAYIYEYKKK